MTAITLANNQHPIQTVAPTLSIGEIQLSADRRSTKEAPLTDAQRIRRVVLPATAWGSIDANYDGARSQALTDMTRAALVKIGSDRLRDMLEESPMAATINASDYTVPALLAWSEETATSRGSITFTRIQAEEWFTNKLWPAISSKYDAAKQPAISAYLKNRYGALAAKNHGLPQVADALKLMALIPAELAGDSISIEVLGRLTHIEKALTAKANESTVSMADL